MRADEFGLYMNDERDKYIFSHARTLMALNQSEKCAILFAYILPKVAEN